MNEEILNNLPIIAIITPIAIAFVIGLFKNKYMNLKKSFVIVALSVSVIAIALMVKSRRERSSRISLVKRIASGWRWSLHPLSMR